MEDNKNLNPDEVEIEQDDYQDQEDENLLELIPGETVIGTITGKYNGVFDDYKILYGNIIDPVINGEVLRLPEEQYMDMVKDFLESEEGEKYRVPTTKEVNDAINLMLNKQMEIDAERARIKAEEEEKRRQQEEEERLQKEELERIEEAQRQQELQRQEEERIAQEQSQYSYANNQQQEVVDEYPPGTLDKKKNKKQKTESSNTGLSTNMKWILGLASLLLIASIVANVFLYLENRKVYNDNYAELNISGQKYQVPLAQVEVKAGETKIMIYGISTTNQGGRIINKAIPLGEFYLDGNQLKEVTSATGTNIDVLP